jgi:peroxiredoxin Q/BCP
MMLEIGSQAPDFTLPDQNGEPVSLSDFRGQTVVLYFYPKDSTPGCTRQARAFAAVYEELQQLGAVVLGVSRDSSSSHLRFIQKNELPFRLLSDPDRTVLEAYGVWQEKKLYGKISMGIVRTTYLIDGTGIIRAVMPKVKPDQNPADVLALIQTREEADQ